MQCLRPILLFRRQLAGTGTGSSNSTKNSPQKCQDNKLGNEMANGNVVCKTLNIESLSTPPTYLLPSNVEQSILVGDFGKFVRLPTYVSRDEWIASHVWSFARYGVRPSNYYNLCNRTDTPLCWDNEIVTLLSMGMPLVNIACTGSSSTRLAQSASMFIDYALTWIDQQLEDPQKFPVRLDGVIRADFEKQIAKPIFTTLFAVICHIYHKHYPRVEMAGQIPHLNALFAHFFAFSVEFDLVSPLDLRPMDPLRNSLLNL